MNGLDINNDWKLENDCIKTQYTFKNFKQALLFMNEVGAEAERLNHHPDWSNSYNRVEISLTTHDVGGLTKKDFELANVISEIAGRLITK